MTGVRAERRPDPRALTLRVWAVTFGYAAVSALLVQLVILPHLFPAWHAGNGLLVGGDWITFHNDAVRLAERIRSQGWSAFELRPMELGNAPAGIASAVYALTVPRPWTLIPLNAALHATAAALLFHLLRGFVTDWRWAAIGTAPFAFYPSALVWISQIHKDGFAIAGYLSLFVAWAGLARHDPVVGQWRALPGLLVLLPVGFGLVWLVRPDLTVLALAATGLALAILAVRLGARAWRDPSRWRRGAAVLAAVVVAVLAGAWLTGAPSRFLAAEATPAGQGRRAASSIPWRGDFAVNWVYPGGEVGAIPWYESPWLPAAVDRAAYQIALTRERFALKYLDSLSNVDLDVGFYRAADLVRYLPRALQVALLAPFPAHWRDTGSLPWTTVGRRVAAVEMLGVYLGLLSLLVVAWRWRRRAELWIVALPCLGILGVYSLAVSNLGALHRFRYAFLMVLVGLGLAGGLDLLSQMAAPATRRAAR